MGVNMNVQFHIDYPLLSGRYVVCGLLFYMASMVLLQPEKSGDISKPKKKGPRTFGTIEAVIFVHNVVLAIFSVLCFLNTAPPILRLFSQYGYGSGICYHHRIYDPQVSDFGKWAYYFYLSKYWEFIDSWIVIARGRRPIFLQKYHHIGAVIGVWLANISHSSSGYLFIVQNSFVHSIMYPYYAVSVFGYKWRFKHVLTALQMIQFINGLVLNPLQLYMYHSCLSAEEVVCNVYNQVYGGYLLYLFAHFYQRSYLKETVKTKTY